MLLLLLALAGAAAGWSYAEQGSEPVITGAVPGPVAAADPAIPFTPPEKTKPNSDLPPVPTSLPLVAATIVTQRGEGIAFPVPQSWGRTNSADRPESRFSAPGSPSGSYSVRVQLLDEENRSLAQKVAARVAELPFDTRISALEILQQSTDTLVFSYLLDGYRRLQVVRWVSFTPGTIDVEIAASGRLVDQAGLEALVARMATDVAPRRTERRQQPATPTG